MALRLRALTPEFAVARLDPSAAVPEWTRGGCLTIVARTADELSVLVEAVHVPDDVRNDRGWCAFVIEGPLPFTMTGVLASILQPLAAAAIPILALSTFDTDYVFVRRDHRERAMAVLTAAGHDVTGPPPVQVTP